MTRPPSKKERESTKELERGIRLAWESLDSHLPWIHRNNTSEGSQFHRQCIVDYAEMILIYAKRLPIKAKKNA